MLMVHNYNHYKQKMAIWRFPRFPPNSCYSFSTFSWKIPWEISPDRAPEKGLRTHFAVPDLPQILRGSTRVHRSVAAAALNAPLNAPGRCKNVNASKRGWRM